MGHMDEKQCLKCRVITQLSNFRLRGGKPHPWCRLCERKYAREYYRSNKQEIIKRRNDSGYPTKYNPVQWRRMKYGISESEFQERLAQQRNSCAICGTTANGGRAFDVDHDHKTGDVRGLLCAGCNRGIGQLKESAELLRKAADYLDQWQSGKRGRL